jgi:hypothetical protein
MNDSGAEGGAANRVALHVAMRNLKEHMTGKGVRFNDEDLEDVYFSLVDLLVQECGMTYGSAYNCISTNRNLKISTNPEKQAFFDHQTYEFNNILKTTTFRKCNGDACPGPGVTLEGFFRIMLLLPGSQTKSFRDVNHDLYVRHNAGDETLDLERLANAQSTTDPIKVALRQRLIARKHAAASCPRDEPVPAGVEAEAGAPDGPLQQADKSRKREQREQREQRERAAILERQREEREERKREKLQQTKRKREERDRFEFEHPGLLDRVVYLERENSDLKQANKLLNATITVLLKQNVDLTQRITLLEDSRQPR